METIRILRAPKEAFNKNRRVSDLIRQQVNHFKHVESRLPADVRQGIPQHAIVTEDDAARYIAAMTRALRSGTGAVKAPTPISATARPTPAPAPQGLSLAAAAGTASQAARLPASKTRSTRKTRKSSSSKGKK